MRLGTVGCECQGRTFAEASPTGWAVPLSLIAHEPRGVLMAPENWSLSAPKLFSFERRRHGDVRRGWIGMQRSPNQAFALIADDDADIRAFLSEAVSRTGLASVQVEDGREAIGMLADLYPSVVLLDVQMPGLSGIEICWWIRRQRHLSDVPVILVSALTSQFEIDAGLLAEPTTT